MGVWGAFKEFFDRRELAFAPMSDPFIQIDRAVVSERLQLQSRGAQQGALNLPSADMVALDAVEADVASHIAEHYSRAQIDMSNSVRTYDSRLSGLTLLSKLVPIQSSSKLAVSEFKAEVANTRNRLSNSRDAIVSSYGELQDFRTEHNLKRPAHPSPSSIVTISAIGFSWLFETALNSLLLRQNDRMGLLGGVVAAGAIGALNVGLAAFVGRYAWPLTSVRDWVQRTLGWVCIAAWIVVVGTWNLLAAHYRDAKSLGIPNPETQALSMMGGGLDSIYSWGLLGAGIVFALIAATAAFGMDDPYPNYGAITRRHDRRCEDYADEIQAATEQLLDIRNAAVEEAVAVRTALEQQLAERDQIIAAREAFARRFEEFGAQLEQAANALLQEYRSANLAARTEPAPKHFKASWTLSRAAVPPLSAPPVNTGAINATEAAVEAAINELTAAFDEALSSFEPLDALKQRLVHG